MGPKGFGPCRLERTAQAGINYLPNDKILDQSKMKDLTDDKINATQKLNFVLGRVENIVGKGENAGYQLFLLFLQCSQKVFYTGSLKDDKRM